jgi:hypothetical protein
MPDLNGTGPQGGGPMTGRGRGNCRRGQQQNAGAPMRGRGFGGGRGRGRGRGGRRLWPDFVGRDTEKKTEKSESA